MTPLLTFLFLSLLRLFWHTFHQTIMTKQIMTKLIQTLILLFLIIASLTKATKVDWNTYVKYDDMLVMKSILTNLQSVNSTKYPTLWTYGIVPYEISSNLYWHKYVIEKAMDHISKVAPCVQFVPHFNEKNYLYITSSEFKLLDPDQTGHSINDECSSYVGMKGERQELVLGPRCLQTGVILHELMHALGFYHEHTRPDRDNYLYIFLENVEMNKTKNFDIIPASMYRMVTSFDYQSIMIYGETAFSKNGLPTMMPVKPHYQIANPGTKKELSFSDAMALQLYYSCI